MIVHSPGVDRVDDLFHAAAAMKWKPIDAAHSTSAHAAVYARENGTGSSITTDPRSGSWLLAAGTWFHESGLAAGEEARLLSRMLEVGPERSADELEGFFVIAFYDGRNEELIVITDLVGSKHCFIRKLGRSTVISSSSLLLARLEHTSLDPIGCEEFLRTGVIYQGRTLYREIQKIPAAGILRFEAEGQMISRTYWSFASLDPDRYDGDQAVSALLEALPSGIRKIGRAFHRPVCDLTGGYDSRALVSAFLYAGVDFETAVAGDSDSPDVIVSRGLAGITGKNHSHLEFDGRISIDRLRDALFLTDGEYDLIDYARIRSLQKSLLDRYDITINGSFGELARGYWWELLRPEVGKRVKPDAAKIAARRYAVDPDSEALFPRDGSLDLVDHFAGMIERVNATISDRPNSMQMDNAYLNLRMQHWQGRIASATDRVWPCLSPFMMRPVMEIMLQTRARSRDRSLLARMLMAKLHPRIAGYPLEHGHPALPLTWRTWPQFAPALGVYARKAAGRVNRKLGLGGKPRSIDSGISPAHAQLRQEPEIQDLLDAQKMKLGALIEKKRLAAFLAESREPHFRFGLLWNRVLSLEMALAF